MAPPTDRQEILKKLRGQIGNGQAIVGGGAGVGLSAKFAEAGGTYAFLWLLTRPHVVDSSAPLLTYKRA